MKKALIIVGVIVLVLAAIVWQVVANLDSIVAGVIEDTGSKVLKTEVSVSGVQIDLKAGKAGIAGLTIANPDGYSSANLFEMDGIEVGLDLGSIGKDVLVITSILVQDPKVNFEGNEKGGSNMQTLLDNINSGSKEEAVSEDGEALKMIINRFEFTGGQVKATSKLKPDEVLDLKLPPIKMSDIGKAQGGVTADVVAKEITSKLVGAVIAEAAKSSISRVIEEKSKGLLDKLKGKN
jgi:uncharacterized protein involved in outer membrane biogenesis